MLTTHKQGKTMFQRLSAVSRLLSATLLLGSVLPSPAVFASEAPTPVVVEAQPAPVAADVVAQPVVVAPSATPAVESARPEAAPAPTATTPDAPAAEATSPVASEASEPAVASESTLASTNTESSASSEAPASDAATSSVAPAGNLYDEDYNNNDVTNGETTYEQPQGDAALRPRVEVSVTERAHYEYEADETDTAGDEDIVVDAQDGTVTTTTTYKRITAPAINLGAEAEAILNSDHYRYTDETIYSVDNSQTLPSDRIVIDKLFVSVPATQNLTQTTGIRDLVQSDYTVVKPTAGDLTGYTLTTEMLDPTNPQVRSIQYYKPNNVYGTYELMNFSRDEDLYNELFEKSYAYLIELSSGGHVERLMPLPQDQSVTQAEAVKRYFAKQRMSDSLYADAKANYQRFELAANQLQSLKTLDTRQQSMLAWAKIAFEGITQRYNYINGSDQLNIHYEGNVPEEAKRAFENKIKQIPFEYRKNLVYLRVTDQKLPSAAKTDEAVGLAYYATGNIDLMYYTNVGGYPIAQPDAMLVNLVHEIGHIVDANGGIFGTYEYAYPATHRDSRSNVLGFRYTKEFQEIFNNFIKGRQDYMSYYTENIEEAFAEFMGRYVAKRTFNWEYPRYKNVNGNLVWAYANDPESYSPMDYAEPYFAKLYSELFERPTGTQIVVDEVTQSYTPVRNGLIRVGTKPEETYVDVPFETEEVEDDTLDKGTTEIAQVGVNGQILRLTTYALADRMTGELISNTTETIVKDMIKQIVRVGTRVADEASSDAASSESSESSAESVSSESAAESSSEVDSSSDAESTDPASESSTDLSSESSESSAESSSSNTSSESIASESSEATSESSSAEVSSDASSEVSESSAASSSESVASESSASESTDPASESSSESSSASESAAESSSESSSSAAESSTSASESSAEASSDESVSSDESSVSESKGDQFNSGAANAESELPEWHPETSQGDQTNSGAANAESELPEGSVPAEVSSHQEGLTAATSNQGTTATDNHDKLPETGSQAEAGFFALGLVVMLGGLGLVMSKRQDAA